ncbi:MAG: hypothetical protein ABIS26_02190 [Candidatus Paceibacterota bacterium]
MKKYIGIIILAGLVFSVSLGAMARAEGSTSSTSPSQIKDSMKAKREAFKSSMEAKKEAFKLEIEAFKDKLKADREAFKNSLDVEKDAFKKASEDRKAKFCSAANNMLTKKFEGAISALERLQTRTGNIIAELHAEGKDTTLATESLNLSKQKLAEAKAKLVTLKTLIPANCTTLSGEGFKNIKLGAREGKDLLKESRESLHQVIKEIKTLRGEDQGGSDESDKD